MVRRRVVAIGAGVRGPSAARELFRRDVDVVHGGIVARRDHDAGGLRSRSSSDRERAPRFDRAIAPGGYQWHYVDGVSDDGRFAVVVIALLGNPFSSAYARAGLARPLDHCAMHVVVYGPSAAAWSLTERTILDSHRSRDSLSIGPSEMRWDGDALCVSVDEARAPFGGRIRGRIRFLPESMPSTSFALDDTHRWWPVAPSGRLEVDLGGVRFTGRGYHDANAGDAALPTAFEGWNWSRAHDADRSIVAYDSTSRSGEQKSRLLVFDRSGRATEEDAPTTPLARTKWGLSRSTRGTDARVIRSLEDGPCYARALVETTLLGRRVLTVHESLSCDRLAARWVRFLMPFRMRSAK